MPSHPTRSLPAPEGDAERKPTQANGSESGDPAPARLWWAPAVILVAGLAAYANSFWSPFYLNDLNNIVNNPAVRVLWPPWTVLADSSTRPLPNLSFALNYAMGQLDVRPYHVTNLAIHLAAALLLLGIVRRTLRAGRSAPRYGRDADGLALTVALLWLVHPLQTESVTYIVQRDESLMGMFYLATLYGFLRAQDPRRPNLWYEMSVIACILGMGSKEVMATAPVVVLWYDRALVATSWREILAKRWAYYLALTLLMPVIPALLFLYREQVAHFGGLSGAGVSPSAYAVSQPGVIVHYLSLSFWPSGQCFFYRWPVARAPADIWPPLVLIELLVGFTIWGVLRRPGLGFLGACFFLILAPTSSFVPIIDLAFEHRMYLPLAPVVIGAVLAAHALWRGFLGRGGESSVWRKAAPAAVVAGVVAALIVATHQHNEVYRDERVFWSDVVAKAEHNPRAHLYLALALAEEGDFAGAIEHNQAAIRLGRFHADAYTNLGRVWAAQGDFDKALANYEEALRWAPKNPWAHYHLANLLASRQPDQAIDHYRLAITYCPTMTEAHDGLATVLRRQEQAALERKKQASAAGSARATPGDQSSQAAAKKQVAPRQEQTGRETP